MQGLLFTAGLLFTFVGGVPLVLSEIMGTIVVLSMPFVEISRHDEPERFHFWRSVMSVTLLAGILLLAAAWAV